MNALGDVRTPGEVDGGMLYRKATDAELDAVHRIATTFMAIGVRLEQIDKLIQLENLPIDCYKLVVARSLLSLYGSCFDGLHADLMRKGLKHTCRFCDQQRSPHPAQACAECVAAERHRVAA